MAGVFSRLKQLWHGWNAFVDEPPQGVTGYPGSGSMSYYNPSRQPLRYSVEKTIISSIYTRLSIDAAGIEISHVNTDLNGRYSSDRKSGLQNCLSVEANIDQGARHFRQDIFETMIDKGTVAIVPVDTTSDPNISGTYDIQTMRVGEITGWYPQNVRVELYNEAKGYREPIEISKRVAAIAQNPLFAVMNQPNSTLQRLIRKLNLLDAMDEAVGSGKLNMIIQLPYVVRSETRKAAANQRLVEIEDQLKNSPHGIAYTDGTEKITQLNVPLESNLLTEIQYLQSKVYSELGLTDTIMNGTADESTMLNYIDRTIKPLLDAVTEAMKRTFLTRTARAQGQSIMYFRDPFSLVPLSQIAEIADTFSRNVIGSPNDIRTAIGWKPSSDPDADKMINRNMPQPPTTSTPALPTARTPLAIGSGGNSQNGS